LVQNEVLEYDWLLDAPHPPMPVANILNFDFKFCTLLPLTVGL